MALLFPPIDTVDFRNILPKEVCEKGVGFELILVLVRKLKKLWNIDKIY